MMPLLVQQAKAYPETFTGRFESLADFEDTPAGTRGFDQVRRFHIDPQANPASRKFVVNITRTGVGAMRVLLKPDEQLVFTIPHLRDFKAYSVLSLAVYSELLRDDFQVTLITDGADWTSRPILVKRGWNTVLIDIQRLTRVRGFKAEAVRQIQMNFADASEEVLFYLDDILLIDNRRLIEPSPPALALRKAGLDYFLALPGRTRLLALTQDDDGLWRMGAEQAVVSLSSLPVSRSRPGATKEDLRLLGRRKVGRVELLEHNAVRIRLANTWFFPARPGEWASLGVPQIRWEYTFYADGREVTHMTVNNSGGEKINSVEVLLSRESAWAHSRQIAAGMKLPMPPGPVGRWSWLSWRETPRRGEVLGDYLRPGKIVITTGRKDVFATGDFNRDRFDESQGCFFLAAQAGQCRFTVFPPAEGMLRPVFRIVGPWREPVSANSEGLMLKDVAMLADGTVLVAFPGRLDRPTAFEVSSAPRVDH